MTTFAPQLNRCTTRKSKNGVHQLRTDLLEQTTATPKEAQQNHIKIKLLKRLILMKLEQYLEVGMVVRNLLKYVDLQA